MTCDAKILIGQILKLYGFDGTVIVKLDKSPLKDIKKRESVFLEIQGRPVPFFIAESVMHGRGLLRVRFEGYDSADKIREFIGCRILLPDNGPVNTQDDILASLKGYKVLHHDGEIIGTIRDISENPGQWLIIVETISGDEMLIPFHEDLIVKINKRSHVIIMDLPDGLTELNL